MSDEVGVCLLDGMSSFVFPLEFTYGILVNGKARDIRRSETIMLVLLNDDLLVWSDSHSVHPSDILSLVQPRAVLVSPHVSHRSTCVSSLLMHLPSENSSNR